MLIIIKWFKTFIFSVSSQTQQTLVHIKTAENIEPHYETKVYSFTG